MSTRIHLAIIHADPERKLSARLTQLFTGSTAYHCGFVVDEANFFDMHWRPRVSNWPRYDNSPEKSVNFYPVPGMTVDGLLASFHRDANERYGVLDYLWFGPRFLLRKLPHLIGASTPNMRGLICSELCARWMRDQGIDAPIKPVPSPADLERWARTALAWRPVNKAQEG